ncbi:MULTISPECIES: hypothetical protein [Citromicrobium]|uniref:hypothetical protein n=1 Tax=Citromicrobium TaxID=72173 RepID=UPI0001DD10C0|nr:MULTISPECIES: hypothetical protein [Citromicrobium]ALG60907.1 hypothetical protein WG74_08720 [Citromicrobium sp. JL477]
MIFDWPANLVPQQLTIMPPSKTSGLSTSLSGFTQAVPAIRPPFRLRMEFGNLFGDEVLAWRAAMGLFEGRTNIARIPLFDLWFRANDPAIGAGSVSHSDGSAFSDGTLYVTDDLSGVTTTTVQGQRNIAADFGSYGQLLQAGLYFGLGEHCYLATGVWWNGTVATIRTTPTMRKAYAGEALKLRPVMRVGLPDDNSGELSLKTGRYGGPSLDLVERFDEPLS